MELERRKSTHPAFETQLVNPKEVQGLIDEVDVDLAAQDSITATVRKPIQYDNPSIGPDPRPKETVSTIAIDPEQLKRPGQEDDYAYKVESQELLPYIQPLNSDAIKPYFSNENGYNEKDYNSWMFGIEQEISSAGYTQAMETLSSALKESAIKEGGTEEDANTLINYAKEAFKYTYSTDIKARYNDGDYKLSFNQLHSLIEKEKAAGRLPAEVGNQHAYQYSLAQAYEKYPTLKALHEEYKARKDSLDNLQQIGNFIAANSLANLGQNTISYAANKAWWPEDLPMSPENQAKIVNSNIKNVLAINGIPYRVNNETDDIETFTGYNNKGELIWQPITDDFWTTIQRELGWVGASVIGGVVGEGITRSLPLGIGTTGRVVGGIAGSATGAIMQDQPMKEVYNEMGLGLPLPIVKLQDGSQVNLQNVIDTWSQNNLAADELLVGSAVSAVFALGARVAQRLTFSKVGNINKQLKDKLTKSSEFSPLRKEEEIARKREALTQFLRFSKKVFDTSYNKPFNFMSFDMPKPIKNVKDQELLQENLFMAMLTQNTDALSKGRELNYSVSNVDVFSGFVDDYHRLLQSFLNTPQMVEEVKRNAVNLYHTTEAAQLASEALLIDVADAALRHAESGAGAAANVIPTRPSGHFINDLLKTLQGDNVQARIKQLNENEVSLLELYKMVKASKADNKAVAIDQIIKYVDGLDLSDPNNLKLKQTLQFSETISALFKQKNIQATQEFLDALFTKSADDPKAINTFLQGLTKNASLSSADYTNTIWNIISQKVSPEVIEATENQIIQTMLVKYSEQPLKGHTILDYKDFAVGLQKMTFKSEKAKAFQAQTIALNRLFDSKNEFHIDLKTIIPILTHWKNSPATQGGLRSKILNRLVFGTWVALHRSLLRYIPGKTSLDEVLGSEIMQTLQQNKLNVNRDALANIPISNQDISEKVLEGYRAIGIPEDVLENMNAATALSLAFSLKLVANGADNIDFVAKTGDKFSSIGAVNPNELHTTPQGVLAINRRNTLSKKDYENLAEDDERLNTISAYYEVNENGDRIYTPLKEDFLPTPIRQMRKSFPNDCSNSIKLVNL